MTTSPIIQIAAFLKRREPWLRKEPRNRLLEYVSWYWRSGRIGVIREHGKIVAVALARCVNTPAQAKDPYYHDESGKLVWVDHIASTHELGVPLLLQQAMQRFGPREAFAGEIFRRDGELRMLPMRIVERLVTQPNGITINSSTTAAA